MKNLTAREIGEREKEADKRVQEAFGKLMEPILDKLLEIAGREIREK